MSKGRGGARPGAGRPAKDGQPREKITVTIPAHLRDKLDAFAAANGLNRSEAVSMALEMLKPDKGTISLSIK